MAEGESENCSFTLNYLACFHVKEGLAWAIRTGRVLSSPLLSVSSKRENTRLDFSLVFKGFCVIVSIFYDFL